jgi:hypothetical protein
MRARIPTLIAGVVGTLGFALFGLSAPAQAAPTGCHVGYFHSPSDGATAWCDGGTGSVRSRAECVWPATGVKVYAYGPWKGPGVYSIAYCPSTEPLLIGWIYQTKN